jgi:hypothetical protein
MEFILGMGEFHAETRANGLPRCSMLATLLIADAKRKGIREGKAAPIWPDTLAQGDPPVAGPAIRLHRQIHSRSHRRSWAAAIPRSRRHPRERAHVECRRNGRCICRRKSARNDRGNENAWTLVERGDFSRWLRLHPRCACGRLSYVARENDRGEGRVACRSSGVFATAAFGGRGRPDAKRAGTRAEHIVRCSGVLIARVSGIALTRRLPTFPSKLDGGGIFFPRQNSETLSSREHYATRAA